MSASPLIIAIPSKGRLQENTFSFFARLGFEVAQDRGMREYRGILKGLEGVEIAFLSASEITDQIARGNIHLGITGEDLVREALASPQEIVEFLAPLHFGHADVVVAVPQAWIDVRTMADLEDVAARYRNRHGERMRVATKYMRLTHNFFREKEVVDYRMVESLGATEGAPAAGQAELIVDITSTGATLRANGLKILEDGIILKSQAHLIASLKANWQAAHLARAQHILARMSAEMAARASCDVRIRFDTAYDALLGDIMDLFDARPLFGNAEANVLHVICPEFSAPHLAQWVIQQGARAVSVQPLTYLFEARNECYERLVQRLDDHS